MSLEDCNRVLDEDGAEFSSPFFPSPYPNNAFCEFHITARLGQRIQIYFDHFNLEEGANCTYDALRVRTGGNKNNSSQVNYRVRNTNNPHFVSFSAIEMQQYTVIS